jgi:hypothetical protein
MKVVITGLFFLITLFARANDSLVLVKSIPIEARLFTTDLIGNCYVIKENNFLIKYNASGDSIAQFNEVKKGKVTQIDATNPLRILLYYADFNQVIILDNMLSKKNVLKLNTIGIFNAPCIANSMDGNIWVYDQATNNLFKLDNQLALLSTTNLRNMLTETIDPIYMVEQERNLFMVDSLQGIYKFDLYGFYNTTYHFKTKAVQYFNGYLVYQQIPFLFSYQTQTILEKRILLPNPASILQVRIERNKLFILRKNTLDIYDLIQS